MGVNATIDAGTLEGFDGDWPPEGKGLICIMDATGDTKTIWDPNNPDEVASARNTFDTLRAKGYLAYSVKADGEKGDVVVVFDPKAGKIILTPPLKGG